MDKVAMNKLAMYAIEYGYNEEVLDIEKDAAFYDKLLGAGVRIMGKGKPLAQSAGKLLMGSGGKATGVYNATRQSLKEVFPGAANNKYMQWGNRAAKKVVGAINSIDRNFFPQEIVKNRTFAQKMRWPMIGLGSGIMIGGTMGYKNTDQPPTQRYYG